MTTITIIYNHTCLVHELELHVYIPQYYYNPVQTQALKIPKSTVGTLDL